MVSLIHRWKQNIAELIGVAPRAITAKFIRSWLKASGADEMTMFQVDRMDARKNPFWQVVEYEVKKFFKVSVSAPTNQKVKQAIKTQRELLNELQEKIDIVATRPRRWDELTPDTEVGDLFDQRFRQVMTVVGKQLDTSCERQHIIWFTCRTFDGETKTFSIEADDN